jgi:hypothetical protein
LLQDVRTQQQSVRRFMHLAFIQLHQAARLRVIARLLVLRARTMFMT